MSQSYGLTVDQRLTAMNVAAESPMRKSQPVAMGITTDSPPQKRELAGDETGEQEGVIRFALGHESDDLGETVSRSGPLERPVSPDCHLVVQPQRSIDDPHRALISLERLGWDGVGEVRYRHKNGHESSGSRERELASFDPAEFLARVITHIPDPRRHLVRYYGWYSNVSRGKRRKAGAGQEVALTPPESLVTRFAMPVPSGEAGRS